MQFAARLYAEPKEGCILLHTESIPHVLLYSDTMSGEIKHTPELQQV